MAEQILKMTNISKSYFLGGEEQAILSHIDLSVNKGDFVAILGPSGSGKSTLMNLIGCLDIPTGGEYSLSQQNVQELDEKELAAIRNQEIGFVFQQFHLLPRLSARHNVELPLVYAGVSEKERQKRAAEMLARVGLEGKMEHRPNQLSGGQQQRVAIARAMVTEPTILLADEPTGALDQKTGQQIMELFHQINKEGKSIIMITHDAEIAKNAGRIFRILDGQLREEGAGC
ncbi:ABC transporter ATP-binding protein [Planococcus shenhongbingii]|uniref:ABC transporter ATP-binding protein n=1 Tax=Planococcus shenhongbingii TaxID=3058398 RepID=UPI00261A9CC4|nr:ABC transporter ATP-binding protein [Planococcus sp. N016]WKA56993.1 ABC transporter ATP-binding protein [Planococcus sp. N016]